MTRSLPKSHQSSARSFPKKAKGLSARPSWFASAVLASSRRSVEFFFVGSLSLSFRILMVSVGVFLRSSGAVRRICVKRSSSVWLHRSRSTQLYGPRDRQLLTRRRATFGASSRAHSRSEGIANTSFRDSNLFFLSRLSMSSSPLSVVSQPLPLAKVRSSSSICVAHGEHEHL